MRGAGRDKIRDNKNRAGSRTLHHPRRHDRPRALFTAVALMVVVSVVYTFIASHVPTSPAVHLAQPWQRGAVTDDNCRPSVLLCAQLVRDTWKTSRHPVVLRVLVLTVSVQRGLPPRVHW